MPLDDLAAAQHTRAFKAINSKESDMTCLNTAPWSDRGH